MYIAVFGISNFKPLYSQRVRGVDGSYFLDADRVQLRIDCALE